mmetsp:Transcript_39592/g.112283  ORF Transcript_39592/g.112283 Transcript_39592/m.112283 type:complete len:364 (-) Transcript_39592:46-1137(-)
MSLYGDLPKAKHEPAEQKKSSWSGATLATKMLPPSALRKRSMAVSPMPVPTSVKRGSGSGRQEGEPSSGHAAEGGSLSGPSMTEYDPARPNDYEKVRQERERLRLEAEAEAERQAKLKEAEELQKAEEARAAAARPDSRDSALSISGEEAFLRRGQRGGAGGPSSMGAVPPPPGLGGSSSSGGGGGSGMSAAQRMMEKMGWKEGQGLGKARQGMTTPLMAQKTDTHSAVIVSAEPAMPPPPPASQKKPAGVAFQGVPTKVVLLRNMVGPGEVDEQLEDEVAEECTKYGQVNRVLIFEVTEAGFPPTEAVRIFIEFDRAESATKALVDLEGRFFGGRVVRATFFSEDRIAANDLAPMPYELGGN